MAKETQSKKEPTDFQVRQTLRYFWKILTRNKRYVIPVALLQPVTIFLNGFAGMWIMSLAINRLTTETIPADQLLPTFWPYIAGFIGAVAVGELILWRLVTYLHWTMTERVVYDLNQQAFSALSEQSMEFHNNRFGGSLVSQTNKFTGAFIRLSDLTLFNIMPTVYAFLFTFLILGPLLPGFALALGILAVVFMLIAWFSFSTIRDLNVKEADAQNKVSGQIADSITNIMAVKSFGQEAHERQRFRSYARTARQASFKIRNATIVRDLWFGSVITAITGAAFVTLIFGNVWFGASIGTLVLAVNYSTQILGNLWGFNGMLRQLNRAFGDAREMKHRFWAP
ncbi:ABC transporter ATP-binding protein, partial [Candidatus Saccharibacteria bacterium]|nr:ABC transporter ATP-binding protein [Candidatus Saccharibacteria bacterium]